MGKLQTFLRTSAKSWTEFTKHTPKAERGTEYTALTIHGNLLETMCLAVEEKCPVKQRKGR